MDTIHPTVVKIGKTIKAIREERFISQHEFASLVGVSPTTVVKLEGGHEAQRRTVRKIAEALGVSPQELLDRD